AVQKFRPKADCCSNCTKPTPTQASWASSPRRSRCCSSDPVMRLDGRSLGVADGTGAPIRSSWRYWSLECSRRWLYQLMHREDRSSGLGRGGEPIAVDQFAFQARPERLGDRVEDRGS